MPEIGEEIYCGGHTRCYFDEQWDAIHTDDGRFYWRDKKNHITYDCNSTEEEDCSDDGLGKVVLLFDNEEEDAVWDDLGKWIANGREAAAGDSAADAVRNQIQPL